MQNGYPPYPGAPQNPSYPATVPQQPSYPGAPQGGGYPTYPGAPAPQPGYPGAPQGYHQSPQNPPAFTPPQAPAQPGPAHFGGYPGAPPQGSYPSAPQGPPGYPQGSYPQGPQHSPAPAAGDPFGGVKTDATAQGTRVRFECVTDPHTGKKMQTRYIVRCVTPKVIALRAGGSALTIEWEVLESMNPQHPPGTRISTYQALSGAFPELIANNLYTITLALEGINLTTPEGIQAESAFKASWKEALRTLVDNEQGLGRARGRVVQVFSTEIIKQDKTPTQIATYEAYAPR